MAVIRPIAVAATILLLPLSSLGQPPSEPSAPTEPAPQPAPPATSACSCARPTPEQIAAFEDWSSRRRTSLGLARWAKRAAMWGGAAVAGALVGSVIGHGSITIDSSSPWLYVAVGTSGLSMSLDIAAYVVNPGPFHAPGTAVSAANSGLRMFSATWQF